MGQTVAICPLTGVESHVDSTLWSSILVRLFSTFMSEIGAFLFSALNPSEEKMNSNSPPPTRTALSGTLSLGLLLLVVWLFTGFSPGVAATSEQTSHIQPFSSSSWCVAGEFNGWNNSSHPLYDDGTNGDLFTGDGIFSREIAIGTAGRTEFKAVECGNWGNAYPGANAWIWLTAPASVVVTFDTNDYAGNAGLPYAPATNIVNVWGDDAATQSFTMVGPWQGWGNANPATAMTDLGNGRHILTYTFATAGNYEAKVSATDNWDYQVGADGRSVDAPTINFNVPTDGAVMAFYLDALNGRLAIVESGASAGSWCVAGGFNGWSEDGFPLYDDGTNGDLIGGDGVFSRDVVIETPGRYEFKINACNWSTSYPGSNAWVITSEADQVVKFTFDTNDYSGDAGWPFYPTTNIVNAWDSVPDPFTAVGPWQGWNPNNLDTTLTDLGHNQKALVYPIAAAGDSEVKITNNEWANQVGGDGRGNNADTVAFTIHQDSDPLNLYFDGNSGRIAVFTPEADSGPELPPIDLDLVRAPVTHPVQDENFYFLLPDRFEDGDPANNTGGISGDHFDHGYLPTHKNFFHGGDLVGLTSRLDYLEGMGVTALWITPVFKNDVLEGSGTDVNTSYAGYHGYWILDFESIDPHLGTDLEFAAFVDAAHARGMKVYLDIVANHTGNMIQYLEGQYSYRNKTDYPYRDADGNIFDDRDYVGTGTFPELDPLVSFPYTPIFEEPEHATIKNPDWLNNPIYYHNRGDTTFSGESSTYGDFFGLDDLFTEHPDVVIGFIDIFTNTIANYNIDGFRIDTVKHVNIEFWQEVLPAVMDYAVNNGKPDFFMFGEVFDYHTPTLSRYTTEGMLPSVLDFQTQGYAYGFAIKSEATSNLQTHFANDDYYTDADSNAYQLANFISNHDIGRFGGFIRNELGGTPNDEWLARSQLGHALMYFARGFPIVYYGDEQGFVSDGGDADAREDMFPSQVASYNDNLLIGTTATTADSNFDATHPLYLTFADYAAVRSDHLALRRGAQIHRYGQNSAGIYAFSRIERDEQIEYVVALNNATTAASATFPVYMANMGFTAVYPSTEIITSTAGSELSVTLPAFGVAIYRANAPLAASAEAPDVSFYAPAANSTVSGRVEVGVSLGDPNAFVEVNFAVKIGGGPYEYIGTDNNAPYRIFYDVSGIADGTPITFQAIVNDLNGNYKNNIVSVTVVGEPSAEDQEYVIFNYFRPDGDYGDFSSNDFNDFWGIHVWGNAIHPDDINPSWDDPVRFSDVDECGAYVALRLVDPTQPVNYIFHRGNDKDVPADQSLNVLAVGYEIWIYSGDETQYTAKAEGCGRVNFHYQRADGDYGDFDSPDFNDFWGLHLWQNWSTEWTNPYRATGDSDFGKLYSVTPDGLEDLLGSPVAVDYNEPLNFIMHRGNDKDGGSQNDRSVDISGRYADFWLYDDDATVYRQRGAALNTATIHYHRCLGDYGDYNSNDYNDFWGLHTWGGATDPGWTTPRKVDGQTAFGVYFDVPLFESATALNYILHRGDLKDVPEDQSLDLAGKGYEIWIVEGDNGANMLSAGVQFTHPAVAFNVAKQVCAGATIGNINRQRAYWLAENVIGWAPNMPADVVYLHAAPTGGLTLDMSGISGGTVYTLTQNGVIGGAFAAKFPHLTGLPAWEIDTTAADVPEILKGQIAVSAFAAGALVDATGLQIPGVLDDLYAANAYDEPLGIVWDGDTPTFKLWAPTAKSVTLHRFADSNPATTSTTYDMVWDADSGIWSYAGLPGWKGQYYLYEVEVYVHSTGQVEHNIVTDPYSVSLAMNSTRSQIFDLSDSAWQPAGWGSVSKPPLVGSQEITVYEVHVRDFSAFDESVPEDERGTFKAFTYTDTHGMSHLLSLADAGLTHLHLLPVFDIATINEDKSTWLEPDYDLLATYPPTSTLQQAAIYAIRDQDAFNWGYDPFHYNALEGSYSTNPDGPTRIIEFRELVQNLNENGLRVVVDVVYNHTNASGQNPKSVLDRVVPGYYHRLNANGQVENSTCCDNTATEHEMMEKLMVDSVVLWAIHYKVDAFRFDLMGHHMKHNMLAVRAALDALTIDEHGVDGSAIFIYGEGWNFGEVANNARGINATQFNMAGTGIATFSDRQRDAVRGGGPFDNGQALKTQGFANGLFYDPNDYSQPNALARLLLYSDQIRVGMTGNLAGYQFVDRTGALVTGAQVDYNGSPTGYTDQPFEAITYISKHDNQTLYDINVYGMPLSATMEERVRAQIVGLSTVALGQGVPFFHAGSEMLRSKSLDRDSYNSGDWFNRLDYTYQHNNFGVGLPVAEKNQENWPIMVPYLADPALVAGETDITFTTAVFEELLAIRASSPLFRLGDAALVQQRLAYHNTGPSQLPGLIVMSLSDLTGDDLDPNHQLIVVLINANDEAQTFTEAALIGLALELHPVQQNSVDPVVGTTSFDAATGTFVIPGRTTAVFVVTQQPELTPEEMLEHLIADVEQLVKEGELRFTDGNRLVKRLFLARFFLENDRPQRAIHFLNLFIADVERLVRIGRLDPVHGFELVGKARAIIVAIGDMSLVTRR
jgi:pullulanase-type alpha-1,6-glucosidase